jgi:light-regulated signal transduction histidine kinase (bacteriophytochrome)
MPNRVEGHHTQKGAGGSEPPEVMFDRVGATLPPGIWILDVEGNPFSGSQIAMAELRALSGDSITGSWKEVRTKGRDGSPLTMLTTATPLRNQNGEIAAGLAINLDITEKKRIEDELRKRTVELVKSNANLQQFAHAVSHDLQEPLRAVSGYLELLREKNRGVLDEESNKFIDSSIRAATWMGDTINDLLTYSKANTAFKPFLLTDSDVALRKALDNLKPAIDEVRAEITSEALPTVTADETQLVEVFQNLISNAIKYRSPRQPRIQVSAKQSGADWVFSVKDNGIGIDPRDHDRIFGMFQRLHPRHERPGTGMGLTICKAIVQRHGGRIWVESELGKGATFHFTLANGAPLDQTK